MMERSVKEVGFKPGMKQRDRLVVVVNGEIGVLTETDDT